MEFIHSHDTAIAMLIRHNFTIEDRVLFPTPQDSILQIGYLKHPKNYVVKRHQHNPVRREIFGTQEVLFIKKGKVKIDLFDNHQNLVSSVHLTDGDIILFMSGGHGISILEDSEIVEVKNGPYSQEKDKTHF